MVKAMYEQSKCAVVDGSHLLCEQLGIVKEMLREESVAFVTGDGDTGCAEHLNWKST